MKENELVSQDERKRIAKDFLMKIEGINIPTKVIDVSALAEHVRDERRRKKESMIIELSPLLLRNHKDANRGITHVKDVNFNVVYGIYAELDHYKNIVWVRILLENGITLNLDDINDAKRWVVLRMHPLVQGSPFERDPIYKVDDPTRKAKKIAASVNKTKILFDKIDAMNGKEIVDNMRYLGQVVNESLTFDIAKSRLLELAIKKSESTYDKLANKQRGLEAKLLAAVEYDIIQNHSEQGYTYNELSLGISMTDVLNQIENDKTVKASILSQLEEKDVISHNIQTEYEEKLANKKDNKQIF